MGLVPKILTFLSSLRFRLFLLVLLAISPAFVLAYFAGQYRLQQDVEQARLTELKYAASASTIQSQSIQAAHQLLTDLASLPAMRNAGPISCDDFTAELIKQYPFYGTVGMMDMSGNVICQSPAVKSKNLGADPYFRHVLESSQIQIGDYGIGSTLDGPSIELAVLIRDGNDKPSGAVFATLKIDWFDSFATDVHLPNNSTLILTDRNNAIQFHYLNGEKRDTQYTTSNPVALMLSKAQSQEALQYTDIDEVERLYLFAPISSLANSQVGVVGVGLPTDIVLKQAHEETTRNYLLLWITVGIVLAVTWGFGELFLLRGIHALARATQQLSAGNLSVRAKAESTGSELDQLAHRFNQLAETLQQRETERKENELALQKWADIFQNTSVGIVIAGADGKRIESVNPAYADMHGYTIAEMNGMLLENVHAPEALGGLENNLRIVGESKHHVFETKHLRKDGSIFPVLVDATAVTDLDGTLLYRIANVQDLTVLKRAEQAQREQREFADSLRDTAAVLTSTLDFDTVLDHILDNVERVVPHSATHIMRIESHVVRVVRSRGYQERGLGDWIKALSLPLNKFSLVRDVITTNKSRLISDTRTCAEWIPLPEVDWIRSVIMIPLVSKSRPIGILDLSSDTPNFFNEMHIARLEAFADQAAVALENARLLHEASARADQMALLYDAGLALNSVLDPTTQIDFLLRISMRALSADRGEFFRWDPATGRIKLEMRKSASTIDEHWSAEDLTFVLGEERGIVGLAAKQGLPLNIGDLQQDQRWIPLDTNLYSGLWVPVQHEKSLLGVICLFSNKQNAFSNQDERLLVLFANQVAVAMENARLFESQRKRTLEMETLRQASLRAMSTLELPQVLEQILSYTMRLLSASDAHLFLYDGEKLDFAAAMWADGTQREIFQPRPHGLTYQVARTGERIVVPNMQTHPLFADRSWVGAIIGIPLRVGAHVRGVMNLAFTEPHNFEDSELQILDLMADQATVAIENARLFNETRRRADRLTLLNRIAGAINQTLELDDLLQIIYREISNAVHMDAFYIALYDETTNEVDYRIRYDLGKPEAPVRLPLANGWGMRVVEQKKPILIRDSEKETQYPPLGKSLWGSMKQSRSWLGVPIKSGSSIVGLISIQSYSPNMYGEEEERLLMTIANQVASALKNANLFTETRRRLKETEAINRLSSVMRKATRVSEMIAALLEESLGLMNTQVGEVMLYGLAYELEECVTRGWFNQLPQGPLQPSDGISWRVFTMGDVYVCREYVSDAFIRLPFKSLIPPNWGGVCIPIAGGEHIFGVLQVAIELPRAVESHDIVLLKTLAEITGNAVQRVRLRTQTELQVRRLNSLHVVDTAISGSLDLRVTLEVILDQVTAQLGVDAADVLVLNPYDQTLICMARRGLRSISLARSRVRMGEGFPSRAILESQAVSLGEVKEGDNDPRVPDFISEGIVAYGATALIAKGQVCGVLEIFNRTPLVLSHDLREFFKTLGGQAAIAIENINTFEKLQKSTTELTLAYDSTIEAWARILDARHREYPNHTRRVAELALRLARELGVSDQDLLNIRRGALLHDTGKISIPEHILFKTEPLTEEEQTLLRQHSIYAREYLAAIPYLQATLDIPYYQDECWDGTGSPKGLVAEQIPLAARVFAIVHAWIEIRHGSLQRIGRSVKETRDYIQSQSGKRFDPEIVREFFHLLDRNLLLDE